MEQNKKRPREEENIILALVEDDEEEEMLPGFRFHPTDEELVSFYLRRKVEMKRLSIEIIREIDIYKFDPWDLPKTTTGGEKEWYFFCLRGRKYKNSIRPNRVTGSGFWKATGIDRPIYPSSSNTSTGKCVDCIGLKKSLVYHRGIAGKGTKTDWMMHEFRLPLDSTKNDDNAPPSIQEAEVWTVCRIFKRNITYKKDPNREATSKKISTDQYSSSNTSSFESDGGDEYNYYNIDPNNYINYSQYQAEQIIANYNYMQERNQMIFGQMNPMIQNQAMVYNLNGINPVVTNEQPYQQDGIVDELGRMMEIMNQNVIYDNYM